jgi:hypothetical protein
MSMEGLQVWCGNILALVVKENLEGVLVFEE